MFYEILCYSGYDIYVTLELDLTHLDPHVLQLPDGPGSLPLSIGPLGNSAGDTGRLLDSDPAQATLTVLDNVFQLFVG